MSGNTTSLYTTVSSNGIVSSQNFTTLYPGATAGSITPTTGYGNANVVSLLAAGSDGGNTVANIIATGNISGSYFLGNGSQLTGLPDPYGNANVAAFLQTYGGNIDATQVANTGLVNIASEGTVQLQYDPSGAYEPYTIGSGSWLYLDNSGAVFESNTSGTVKSVVLDNAGNVSATGNISGNYILGNGSQLTGLPATYGNANVATFLANFGSNTISTTGNITGGNFIGSGAALTSITGANVTGTVANATYATSAGTAGTVTTNAQSNITSVGTLTSLSSTGNITSGAFFIGDGSQLSNISAGNITGAYGNSNVATYLPTYQGKVGGDIPGYSGIDTAGAGLNLFSGNGSSTTMYGYGAGTDYGTGPANAYVQVNGSGTVSIRANAAGTGQSWTFLANGNLTLPSNTAAINYANGVSILNGTSGSYGNSNVSAYLASGTNSANIITTGNISGTYFTGNGSLLTGITTTYNNSNVVTLLASFGSNTISTTGNITAGNLVTSGTLTSTNYSATGNITAGGYLSAVGNITGSYITTTGVNGNISNANYVTANFFVGNGSLLTGISTSLSGNLSGNLEGNTYGANAFSFVSATGNITGGNILTGGIVSAAGNVRGSNLNTAGAVSATGNIDGGNVNTGGLITATGNITGGNILGGIHSATGNILSGQQTIIGTANTTGGTGNIIVSGKNIATDMLRNTDAAGATTADLGRIVMGTGYLGNTNPAYGISGGGFGTSRLSVADLVYRGNTASAGRGIYAQEMAQLTANVTNTAWREGAIYGGMLIGGGSAANTVVSTSALGVTGVVGAVTVGGGTSGNLTWIGNTVASHATGVGSAMTISAGSTIGNLFGLLSFASVAGTANTAIALAGASPVTGTTGNVFGFYWPKDTSTYGITTSNTARNSTAYYAIRNDDEFAQVKLGSLRLYNEFNYTLTSSAGALTVNKNFGQVQQIDLTEDITSVTFSNFVSSATAGATTKEQCDTVTLIFNQGATGGYNITLPTGSTYKYAGGTNTIGTTADSVTLVTISAVRLSGTTTYLITVSPEFA